MDSPAALVDAASGDLHSAVELAVRSGVGSLAACRESLQRSAKRIEAVVLRLTSDPAERRPETEQSLSRFLSELRAYGALHQAAGILCSEWSRALLGTGAGAYGPPGTTPVLRSAGWRVSLEA